MSQNRQFVVRVLDVTQGAGALVQVDDRPPRWLSANDSLAVDVPVPGPGRWSAFSEKELRLLLDVALDADGVDERYTEVQRVLSREILAERERRSRASGEPDPSQDERRTPVAVGWGRERSTVWACPRCERMHAITGDTWLDCVCGARYRFVYGDEPEADEPGRWAAFDNYEVDEIHYGLIDAESEDPSPDSNSRRRRLIDELASEAERRGKPAATDAQLAGEPSRKADEPERWNGWSDEELDRLGQMLGDGGHELADLQAERRRRHEADDGLSDVERRAVEVLAAGEWPDHPVHGVWRAGCMVAWLKAAGIVLAWEEGE